LLPTSPAIDAAVGINFMGGDIHGDLRPSDVVPDIGADEYIDSDQDGLADQWELQWFQNLNANPTDDGDVDGFSLLGEMLAGTDPGVADSDGDGARDGDELLAATNPLVADTDGDQMPDGYELSNGLNPLRDDTLEDADGDRVPNIFEFMGQSLVNDPDSVPAPMFVVDQVLGNASDTDNVFGTIWEALDQSGYWDEATQRWVQTNPYPVIEVRAGVYEESLIVRFPVALLGQLGAAQGPVEVRSPEGSAISLCSHSAIDGFVITHLPGKRGTGVHSSALNAVSPARLLSNCIIKGNVSDRGGGIINDENSRLRIVHSTIFGNKGAYNGRAISNSNGAYIELHNSIVWGNSGPALEEVYRDDPDDPRNVTDVTIVEGDELGGINEDPRINASGLLLMNSPAINRVATTLLKASKLDLHGERRDQNGTPDLGADEYRDDNGINDGDGLPDWAELAGASASNDDADGDGITNIAEYELGMNPRWNDSDRDGIADNTELDTYFSNPLSPDSDSDGLQDAFEVSLGTSLTNADTDGDGLADPRELDLGTNPISADSDQDGMPDGWEVSVFLNPLFNDAGLDPDGDGLSNLLEFRNGTDRFEFDTDNDGLPDGFEVASAGSLNPLSADDPQGDSDNDGLSNLYEAIYNLNPNGDDRMSDPDQDGLLSADESVFGSSPVDADIDADGLNDAQERAQGTDPWHSDSEGENAEWGITPGDGLPDGWEVRFGFDPLTLNDPDSDADDNDGLSLIQEFRNGTNPRVADSDGDGTNDGPEVANKTSPNDDSWGGAAPASPSAITTTINPDDSETISWVDNANNEEWVRVRAKKADGTWEIVADLPPNSASVTLP